MRDRLRAMIVEGLCIDGLTPDRLGDDTLLFEEDLGLDSFDAVELVILVKERFGVVIHDWEKGREVLQSINTLAAFIERRTGEKDGE